MKFFLDTEYNSFGGALISLALVSECGEHEFYEEVDLEERVHPWVAENVIPKLTKDYTVHRRQLQIDLEKFLKQFEFIEIYADYPADFYYLAKCLEIAPGCTMNLPKVAMIWDQNLSAGKSKVPHNALEDARAIQRNYLEIS